MKVFTGCCVVAFALNSYAAQNTNTLPPNLVKITKDNNPQCVEFVTYKGELYCSTVVTDKSPVDPQILSYEKQNIQFDERPWKAAWSKKNATITTIEYVPVGEDINNWQELITSQFIPGLSEVTPAELGNQTLSNLQKQGITPVVTAIENQPNQLIFEFRVESPTHLQQDEIQKISKGKDGFYILHYVIKKVDMGEEQRKKWIGNLKKSALKNMP